jgi:hypothetical protein
VFDLIYALVYIVILLLGLVVIDWIIETFFR